MTANTTNCRSAASIHRAAQSWNWRRATSPFSAASPPTARPNLSDGYRRQLYLSYNAISDGGHQRDKHYKEFLEWLRKKYIEYGKTNTYFR